MNKRFAVNRALNKPAIQSSTWKDAVAGNAVDTDKNTVACTLNNGVHPWWSVDLGAAYGVGMVTVVNDNQPQHGTVLFAELVYEKHIDTRLLKM